MKFDGDKIRQLTQEQGLSQYAFADKCGFARSQLTTLLKHGSCTPFTLKIIADALDVPITELFPDETKKIRVMLDPGAKMPTRAYPTDAGLDLYAMECGSIAPGCSASFDTGVHVAIPAGYVGLLTSKSGLMANHEITSRGTIDADYRGSIKAVLFNHGHLYVRIEKGQKITQLVIMPCITPEPDLVDSLDETERGSGGFGSTGAF